MSSVIYNFRISLMNLDLLLAHNQHKNSALYVCVAIYVSIVKQKGLVPNWVLFLFVKNMTNY